MLRPEVRMAWWWLLACTGQEVVVPEVPAPVEAPRADEHVFVHASLLRLRPEPRSDTATSSALAINTRLRVRGREGDWVAVTTPDGREGFVHGDYVGAERLTVDRAREEAGKADDPAKRLGWWQRAAALAPGDADVLNGLAEAYRAVGKTAEADAVGRVVAETATGFDGFFAGQKAEVDAIASALSTVGTATALIGLWERAATVTEAMAEPLNARFDAVEADFEGTERMLKARAPWAYLTLYAEGTYAAVELSSDAWKAAAAKTPEPWDDRFFALLDAAYGNASARGWTAWQQREWDYGGCSPFGNGGLLHHRLLLETDALAGQAEVKAPVAAIRADLLADVEQPQGPGEFPYCRQMDEPTPLEGIEAEAGAILKDVALTPEERAMIERRVAASFGR